MNINRIIPFALYHLRDHGIEDRHIEDVCLHKESGTVAMSFKDFQTKIDRMTSLRVYNMFDVHKITLVLNKAYIFNRERFKTLVINDSIDNQLDPDITRKKNGV